MKTSLKIYPAVQSSLRGTFGCLGNWDCQPSITGLPTSTTISGHSAAASNYFRPHKQSDSCIYPQIYFQFKLVSGKGWIEDNYHDHHQTKKKTDQLGVAFDRENRNCCSQFFSDISLRAANWMKFSDFGNFVFHEWSICKFIQHGFNKNVFMMTFFLRNR